MFKEERSLREQRILQARNMLGSRLLRETIPLTVGWHPCPAHRPFSDRPVDSYRTIAEGTTWGSGSDRAWFNIKVTVPAHWTRDRIVVWFDCGTEALIYRDDGEVLHGLTSGPVFLDTAWKMSRPLADVTTIAQPGSPLTLWIEAACLSHPWEATYDTPVPPELSTAGFPNGLLKTARLGWFDEVVWALYMDVEVLMGVYEGLADDSPRRAKIFRQLNLAFDVLGRTPGAFTEARALLQPALAAPAHHSAITVRATGHAHLDTAWLWTTAVAREKAARTFSNQLNLLDRYPGYVFGASTAPHYAWIKEDHPTLFARILDYIKQGRWEVQGPMWVEADTNMPSGEALIRQFLYGKQFFRDTCGVDPSVLWLPDVFGYSAALPQIMRICGVKSLLTQKISWSQFNKFPHHTFRWQGLDGSEVLVHFPPEDNYCSSLLPAELIKAERRFAERDRLDTMLSLFGYGDGGGGPTPFHIERAQRLSNLEGAPRVHMGRADTFFDDLHEKTDLLHRWSGELYLELHRKTLTTQSFIKKANRRLEERLTALEMLASINPATYPADALEALWKTLLLHQFHDIIPGSSVREVYDEAKVSFNNAFATCRDHETIWAEKQLVATPDTITLFNPLSTPHTDLVALPPSWANAHARSADGTLYPTQLSGECVWANLPVPPLGFATYHLDRTPATQPELQEATLLENNLVAYTFNEQGRLIAVLDKQTGRSLLHPGEEGHALRLYNDRPAQWEAWDMDVYYEDELIETAHCTTRSPVTCGPVFSEMTLAFTIGQSTIGQTVRLRRDAARLDFITTVDWHETRRLLRVHFPTNLHATEATYDIQFGTIKRPTHDNTSRDRAMFEVCAHRYADLSEPGVGLALLNDCKYGYQVKGGELSLTLLAAPLVPDPEADRGTHHFTYALLPHPDDHRHPSLRAEAGSLNHKPLLWENRAPDGPLMLPVQLSGADLRLEALKRTEDGQGWIVRISETAGCQSLGTLHFSSSSIVTQTNAIEEDESSPSAPAASWPLLLRPYQVQTWRVTGIRDF